jgi:hypothetical protein
MGSYRCLREVVLAEGSDGLSNSGWLVKNS